MAYRLQSRWTADPVLTPAVIATESAARILGGAGGRFPATSEETHDLHLSAVYLLFLQTDASRARTWIHEDSKPHPPGEKVPDAIVGRESDHTAIEFAGKYPKQKLLDFHQYCACRGLPYELW